MKAGAFLIFATISAGLSWYLFVQANRIADDVLNRLKVIRLGEPLNGPSYQIAACHVFGFLLAFLAIALAICFFISIGTTP